MLELERSPWDLNSSLIPGEICALTHLKRSKVFLENVSIAPQYRILKPVSGGVRWALFFAYSPSGVPFAQHDFTISRLKEDGFRVLVVLAVERFDLVTPDNRWVHADALILKQLKGYDFSGYSIGLKHLISELGSVDVLVLNDSVFGPFTSLTKAVERCAWRITGFTSSFAVENHIQSYAFFIRGADANALAALRSVIFAELCLTAHHAVAYVQETRLARVAVKKGLSVGTLWAPRQRNVDLLMAYPLDILKSGFPFLKRSTVGKFAHNFDAVGILKALVLLGHPVSSKGMFEGQVESH